MDGRTVIDTNTNPTTTHNTIQQQQPATTDTETRNRELEIDRTSKLIMVSTVVKKTETCVVRGKP